MEMDNEIFKQNNVEQGEGNATKYILIHKLRSLCILIHKLRQKYKKFSFFHSKISDIEPNYS